MSDLIKCPFCGEMHKPIRGEVFPLIQVCPKIPEGHMYADTRYERGPDGQLIRIEPVDDES